MKAENRIVLTLLGIGAGHLIGLAMGETEEEKQEFAYRGRWIGGVGTFGLTFALDTPIDMVNYILKKDGCRVYDGITKEYRLNTRVGEHKSSGKIFDEVVFDTPKTRTNAENLERYRISRFRPKYNIRHNS